MFLATMADREVECSELRGEDVNVIMEYSG